MEYCFYPPPSPSNSQMLEECIENHRAYVVSAEKRIADVKYRLELAEKRISEMVNTCYCCCNTTAAWARKPAGTSGSEMETFSRELVVSLIKNVSDEQEEWETVEPEGDWTNTLN
jgi:hypothetical protein